MRETWMNTLATAHISWGLAYLCEEKVEETHQLNQVDLMIPYTTTIQQKFSSAFSCRQC